MHSEFDPDDNFAHAFSAESELDDEAALEAIVWQLLLLINPDDEDAAQAQFAQWRETEPVDIDAAMDRLDEVIEWKAGFRIAEGDMRGLVENLDELAARWRLRIEWGAEDPTDEEFLAATDVPALIGTAFDRLREHHYTLWVRDAGADLYAGWITQSRDDDAMRAIGEALGLHLRPGGA